MEGMSMAGASTFHAEEGDVVNMIAMVPVADPELRALQAMFDASFRRKYTRDRKGAKVPDRLELRRAVRIQNAQNWAEYTERRGAIQAELEERAARGLTLNITVNGLKTAGHLVALSDG